MNVFLSYSHTDKEWADIIRSGLVEAGYQIWNPVDDIGRWCELAPGDGKSA